MKTFENISNHQTITFGKAENSYFWRFQNIDNQYRYNCKITPNSTGKELDAETGYSYFGARYLDHELTTSWLSVDPMTDKYPNISPYAYCAWNPMKLVDPDGDSCVFLDDAAENLFWKVYYRIDNSIDNMKESDYEYNKMRLLKDYFDDVISSSTVFYYSTTPNKDVKGNEIIEGGDTYGKEGVSGICVDFVQGSEISLVHETRHAYGYTIGEWEVNTGKIKDGKYGLYNYDYMDEFEAYSIADSYRYVTTGYYKFKDDNHIRNEVESYYENETGIIREFIQYSKNNPYSENKTR